MSDKHDFKPMTEIYGHIFITNLVIVNPNHFVNYFVIYKSNKEFNP